MRLMQSIGGFKGWIHHCIWSQCDNFLVIVSDIFLYVYYKSNRSGDFLPLTNFKPHDFPVADVFWTKSSEWADPEEVQEEFTSNRKCSYTFVSCSYDGTICLWHMQDIIDGKYVVVDKNATETSKDKKVKWDADVMSYGYVSANCPNTWGKCTFFLIY